jgi:hypothetical protein
VGIERAGQPVLERAYGAADLEHGVANRVDTVFEGCGDKEPIVHRLIHRDGGLFRHVAQRTSVMIINVDRRELDQGAKNQLCCHEVQMATSGVLEKRDVRC